jgi:hypothetical protein
MSKGRAIGSTESTAHAEAHSCAQVQAPRSVGHNAHHEKRRGRGRREGGGVEGEEKDRDEDRHRNTQMHARKPQRTDSIAPRGRAAREHHPRPPIYPNSIPPPAPTTPNTRQFGRNVLPTPQLEDLHSWKQTLHIKGIGSVLHVTIVKVLHRVLHPERTEMDSKKKKKKKL